MRRAVMTMVMAAGIVMLTATTAGAQADRDCPDFAYQEDAQDVLNSTFPADPERLDQDNDGIACEDRPHRPGGGAVTPPPVPAPSNPVVPDTTPVTLNQPGTQLVDGSGGIITPDRVTATTRPPRLPITGSSTFPLAFAAGGAILLGGLALSASARRQLAQR